MIEQQTCPHCGADGYFNVRDADWRYECHSSCNADGAEFYISEDCYERQLAAKDAEIERLKADNKHLQVSLHKLELLVEHRRQSRGDVK